jgi:carboxyl-terminal processing protease
MTLFSESDDRRPAPSLHRLLTPRTLGLLAVALLGACRGRTGIAVPPAPAAAVPAGATLPALPAACGPAARATSTSLAASAVSDPLVTFDSAWSIIARTHWDTTYNGVSWTAVRDELRPRAGAAQTTGQLRAVLSDMLGRLRQSHFSIIPREVADAGGGGGEKSGATPDRSGTMGLEVRWLDSTIVVAQIDRGGPADRAGIRTGWRVLAVNGCPMSARLARTPNEPDLRRAALTAYSVATAAMAGAVGDTATVLLADDRGAERALKVAYAPPRGVVAKFGNLPAMTAQLTHERVQAYGKTVGVIRFNIWMPVLSPQFDAAIDSLRDVDAIVIDLRGNFGGVGGMSMGIAGHFLDSTRTIGTMVQRGATLRFVANPRRVDTRSRGVTPYAGPLALVVDELSISTTEIFAGGLQAMGRAQLFGVQTSGQALPSVPERLPNGDILYHAIADFLSPTGKPLEGDGVRPDRVVPLTRAALLAGRDPALDAAIAWALAPITAK